MTIPSYTETLRPGSVDPTVDGSAVPPADPVPAGRATAGPGGPSHALDRWLDRLAGRPRGVQLALDAAAIGLALLTLAQVGPAEFLFHGIFVLLVVHAFLFGLAGTLWRIGIVSVAILAYATAPALGAPIQQMELSEWPLMFVIAVLVAWMADRRASTARLYVGLFRRASDRLLTVQEDERRRLARELHDGVGQTLTALTLTLDAVDGAVVPGEADARLASARRLAEDALTETRELANRLRPARLDQVGLVAAVRDLASRAGIPVRVEVGPDLEQVGRLDPVASAETYRIVQEALCNAARHSGAREARVALAAADGALRIVVADPGRGFDPTIGHQNGLGLAGMRERAVLLGGHLGIESAPGNGTRVVLEVPLGADTESSVRTAEAGAVP